MPVLLDADNLPGNLWRSRKPQARTYALLWIASRRALFVSDPESMMQPSTRAPDGRTDCDEGASLPLPRLLLHAADQRRRSGALRTLPRHLPYLAPQRGMVAETHRGAAQWASLTLTTSAFGTTTTKILATGEGDVASYWGDDDGAPDSPLRQAREEATWAAQGRISEDLRVHPSGESQGRGGNDARANLLRVPPRQRRAVVSAYREIQGGSRRPRGDVLCSRARR